MFSIIFHISASILSTLKVAINFSRCVVGRTYELDSYIGRIVHRYATLIGLLVHHGFVLVYRYVGIIMLLNDIVALLCR